MVLLLPADVAHQVDALRLACDDPALGQVPPHLTLVPPVNVREEDVAGALDIVRTAAAVTAPLLLEIGPVGCFLPSSPVLLLHVGGPDLDRLSLLRDRLRQGPLRRDVSWPFVPHVTLADGAAERRIAAAVEALAGYAATAGVDSVHLLEQGPGRVWTPMAEVPFGGPVVAGRGSFEVEISDGRTDAAGDGIHGAVPWAVTARRGGRVVGQAVGWTAGESAALAGLAVVADLRRFGIGRRLLAAAEDRARRRGAIEIRTVGEVSGDVAAALSAAGWARSPGDGGFRRRLAT